jgi:hypothetical protein
MTSEQRKALQDYALTNQAHKDIFAIMESRYPLEEGTPFSLCELASRLTDENEAALAEVFRLFEIAGYKPAA